MKKVLITGINGFTGVYLEELLLKAGYDVYGIVYPVSRNKKHLSCNIADRDDVAAALNTIKPDYIIHLAGISFVQHSDERQIYDINLFGTLNILKALKDIGLEPKKILLASSANVYGNPATDIIDETVYPDPVNHYAISKLAMEFKARTYFDRLNILITRPFNYTGVGQAAHFLIPKIVKHFKERKEEIELGNIDVVRDFSDVRFVAGVYKKLMECNTSSEIVNICSGKGVSLKEILRQMSAIARHELSTKVNSDFVRKNEVETLIGSDKKLVSLIGELEPYPFEETLQWMFDAT